MFSSFLDLFTPTVLGGAEPPKVLAPFKTIDACHAAAAKHNAENAAELVANGGVLVCLTVAYPV